MKADGTSTTIYRDGEGAVHVYSRNWEIDPDCTALDVARQVGLVDALNPGMVIQFELCGPGINGNRLKLNHPTPFVFAVWVNHWKTNRDQWPDAARRHAAPILSGDEWRLHGTVDDMIEQVSGLRGNLSGDLLDEGVVWHVADTQTLSPELANELGANRCWKIINNKYLLKHGL